MPSLSELRDVGAVGGIVIVCVLQVRTAATVADALRALAVEVAGLRAALQRDKP